LLSKFTDHYVVLTNYDVIENAILLHPGENN